MHTELLFSIVPGGKLQSVAFTLYCRCEKALNSENQTCMTVTGTEIKNILKSI